MKFKVIFPVCGAIALWSCGDPTLQDPAPEQPAPKVDAKPIVVERIDGRLFKVGTIKQFKTIEIAAVDGVEKHHSEIRTAAEGGFDAMYGNIDNYLDWYYELPQRPAVLIQMVQDGLEKTMNQRLENELRTGDPFASLARELTQLSDLKATVAAASQNSKKLLEQNRLQLSPAQPYDVAQEATSTTLTRAPDTSMSKLNGLAALRGNLKKPSSHFIAESVARTTVKQAANGPTFNSAPKQVSFAGAVEVGKSGTGVAGPGAVTVLIRAYTGGALGAAAAAATKLLISVVTKRIPWKLSEKIPRSAYRNEIKAPMQQQERDLLAKIDSAFAAVQTR